MDTRIKIIPRDQIADRVANRLATWVSGDFDPLLAEHVRRIAGAREPGKLLIVEVTNSSQPLLAQRARAELVAALAMVDFVVLGNGASGTGIDGGVTDRFVDHVLDRHRQESRQ